MTVVGALSLALSISKVQYARRHKRTIKQPSVVSCFLVPQHVSVSSISVSSKCVSVSSKCVWHIASQLIRYTANKLITGASRNVPEDLKIST